MLFIGKDLAVASDAMVEVPSGLWLVITARGPDILTQMEVPAQYFETRLS